MSTGRLGAGDTAIQPTILDAKGDLIVATAADTPARLAIGSNNTVLTADSATATGLKWAALPASGKVLQVVYGSTSTPVTVASTTYTDTGLSLSITPSASTSKILILINQEFFQDRLTDAVAGMGIRILRDATAVFTPAPNKYELSYAAITGSTRNRENRVVALTYLDSPATTSAITYKTQGALSTTANSSTSTFQENSSISTITLLEIGA